MFRPLATGCFSISFQQHRALVILEDNIITHLVPLRFQEYRAHNIDGIMSLTPMSSLSVDLLVFSFCLVELTIGKPLPMVRPPPVCPLMFMWTANDASTYHFNALLVSAPSINGRLTVARRYSIKCPSFLQSSMSGDQTLVVRNAIDTDASGLARFTM